MEKLKEVTVYTEDYHLYEKTKVSRPEWLINRYKELRERILNLGDVEIIPRGLYISFSLCRPFTDIIIYKKGLVLLINMKKGNLNDPNKLTRDVSSVGHWGNGDYELLIDKNTDIDYVMFLINQSFNHHSKK